MNSVVVLVVVLVNFLISFGSTEFVLEKFHREPPPPEVKSTRIIREQWISQLEDHFDVNNHRRWNMRYYSNDEFYQPGGPIFIFVGGEWDISPNWVQGGHMYDMAKQFNGSLFYTEHRFYGNSRPTPDLSVSNLKLLTSEQALADLAHFIQVKKIEIPEATESPVFLVGASYSASLVTWFSHKYPTLVNGVWASSAPLEARTNFKEFLEVVSQSINSVSVDCRDRISEAIREMERLANNGNYTYLSQMAHLCKELKSDNRLDRWMVFQQMTFYVAFEVQYGDPISIQDLICNPIMGEPDALTGFSKFIEKSAKGCIVSEFENAYLSYRNITWPENSYSATRQWLFQTCNEFGWFQTSESPNQPFSSIPVEYYEEICKYLFGEDFYLEMVDHGVCLTNVKYNGLNPNVRNVYSTHGNLDPWKAAGALEYINHESPTYIIPDYSHCSDLNSINPSDSIPLIGSKIRIKDLIKAWGNL